MSRDTRTVEEAARELLADLHNIPEQYPQSRLLTTIRALEAARQGTLRPQRRFRPVNDARDWTIAALVALTIVLGAIITQLTELG